MQAARAGMAFADDETAQTDAGRFVGEKKTRVLAGCDGLLVI